MKKFIFALSIVLGLALVVPAAVSAANLIPECSDPKVANTSACKDVNEVQTTSSNKFYGPDGLLTRVAGLITFIGGIAAVFMIILGGFTFITGSGDPNTLAAARKTVLYAAVGLVVIVLPSAIIQFVMSKL